MTELPVDVSVLIHGALMPGIGGDAGEAWVANALSRGVEAVCLFDEGVGSPDATRRTVQTLRSLSPELLICVDEESGEVTRLQAERGSSLLAPLALGVIGDVEVTRASGRLLGALLRGAGVDWTMGPVADVNVDPRNPVIGVRSFGTDAQAVADQVAAFVDGMESAGVLSCVKHFPGHGDTSLDSHEVLPVLQRTIAEIDERELLPFRAALAAGASSVMTGHLLVPALDPDRPASLSRPVTTGLLRDALGFQGVVVTDAIEMGAVAGEDGSGIADAAVQAIRAGADVICIGAEDQEQELRAAFEGISRAVQDGSLDVALLRAAAQRRAALRHAVRGRSHALALSGDIATVASAAPRSIAVHGDATLRSRSVDVVRIAAEPGYAAGETGWGVSDHLSTLGCDVASVSPEAVLAERDRELVIELRDAWKEPPVLADLVRVLAARPDAVVVDMGWPMDPDPRARGWICSRGTSRLSGAVAACLLAGVDPLPLALSVLNETFLETS